MFLSKERNPALPSSERPSQQPSEVPLLKRSACLISAISAIDRWRHICVYWKRRWKQMWRHLSIAVAALKTVVQRVRSNRWRFNFERARTGGQINFLWKMAMIITITKTSILIICPFPRGLLLTYPISPPLTIQFFPMSFDLSNCRYIEGVYKIQLGVRLLLSTWPFTWKEWWLEMPWI